MRILPSKYPEETEIARWLVFDNEEEATISLVFARRLAALARDNNTKIYVSEGYRSYEKQKYFYDLYLAGKGNLAAKPGLSLHQYHIAVDIGDPSGYWQNKSNKEWIGKMRLRQEELNRYGLCLPLNKMDSVKVEWWHLTPIEYYNGYKGTIGAFILPDDKMVDWSKEVERVKEIDSIMAKLASKISNPIYWRQVLEGKVVVNVDWLRALLLKIL